MFMKKKRIGYDWSGTVHVTVDLHTESTYFLFTMATFFTRTTKIFWNMFWNLAHYCNKGSEEDHNYRYRTKRWGLESGSDNLMNSNLMSGLSHTLQNLGGLLAAHPLVEVIVQPQTNLDKQSFLCMVCTSVPDPWHFGTDPDPRIRNSD